MAHRNRHRLIGVIVLIVVVALAYHFWSPLSKHRSVAATVNLIKAQHSLNQAGVKVFQQQSQQAQGNTVYSPYSANMIFALLAEGSHGNTQQQLTQFLGTPYSGPAIHMLMYGVHQSAPNLLISNSVWIQQGYNVLPRFMQQVQQQLLMQPTQVNFAHTTTTQHLINTFVSQHTQGMITNLLSKPLPASTRLALINTTYFKADWQYPFTETDLQPFYVDGKTPKLRAMMHQTHQLQYLKSDNLHIVALPYKHNDVSFWVIMPDDAKTALQPIINQLTVQQINQWASMMQQHNVQLSLPRFDFSNRIDLIPLLEKLGVTLPFNSRQADFSNMTGKSDLYVSTLLQQAKIQVNETGTKAAASTLSAMNLKMVMPVTPANTIRMVVDHPFIFMIRDDHTGSLLFIGQVQDPDQA